jgi:hypothetical protein
VSRRLLLLLLGALALTVTGVGVVLAVAWQQPHGPQTAAAPVPSLDVVQRTDSRADLGAFTGLRPPDHDRPTAAWMQRHGKLASAPRATCAVCHPPASCRTCHQTAMPHATGWAKAHGKAVLAGGSQLCLRCHQSGQGAPRPTLVSLGSAFACQTCHRLTMPHAKTWVSSGHRVAARADNAVCATCHTRKTCETCHASTQVSTCRTCHAKKFLAVARPGGHATSQCLTCHQQVPSVIGPGPGHRTVPLCLRCHGAKKLAPPVRPQSVRDWTTTYGLGYAAWAKRGTHSAAELANCSRCHSAHSTETISFPLGTDPKAKGCGLSCHSWLKGNVTSRGFLNASGDPEQTTYRGPISPELLLANGTTKHSTVVYASSGCAGRCHQGRHGTVTPCISCHSWKWEDVTNLHGTHVSLVTAERAVANPADNSGQAVCMYCHKPGTNGVRDGTTLWKRACYNCHLSGHNPVVPYWKVPAG